MITVVPVAPPVPMVTEHHGVHDVGVAYLSIQPCSTFVVVTLPFSNTQAWGSNRR